MKTSGLIVFECTGDLESQELQARLAGIVRNDDDCFVIRSIQGRRVATRYFVVCGEPELAHKKLAELGNAG